MTVDDESSVYVGGLPYDTSEESLRDIFALYGSVVAVKIINDRSTRGKCYGFVTFTNPRSATDAITDMNGRTINGRVIRVNDVKTRGGRPSFGQGSLRHSNERVMDRDRDRDRERGYGHERVRHWDRYSDRDRSRERDPSLDYDQDRDRRYERAHDPEILRDHYIERDSDMLVDDIEREHSRDPAREHDMDLDGSRQINRKDAYEGTEFSRKRKGSSPTSHQSGELSPESLYNNDEQCKEQLEISIQKHEELKEEISRMEEKLDEKQQFTRELEKKSNKLEDLLTSAKRLTSQRKMQLTKLHKCYLQVRDNAIKLKSCEQELQALVGSALADSDLANDINSRHGVLVNGNA